MPQISSCDELKGRERDICRGEVNLPINKINIYRQRWGMPGLDKKPKTLVHRIAYIEQATTQKTPGCGGCGGTKTVSIVSEKPLVPLQAGPGKELLNYYKSLGMPVCPACHALASKMNEWGIEGCRNRVEEIVDDILPRAKLWMSENVSWIHKLIPTFIEDAALKFKLTRDVLSAINSAVENKPMLTWAYGLTTVPGRSGELFPRTLASLAKAGFDNPRLFIDGCQYPTEYEKHGLETTTHYPNLRTAGNWVLSLYELYIRNPDADRYAIFQDDFVTGLNLRLYLDCCEYPTNGYWNLYTFPANQKLCPEGKQYQGWYPADQYGKGAVALVFNCEAVCTLLSQRKLVDRPQDVKRGHKAIDGGIVDALSAVGWVEYVHNPSLVQHTGLVSSMGNNRHPIAENFPGENFDFMTLIPNREIIDAKLKQWEIERQSLEKAMREDEERLAKATIPAERATLQAHIQRYKKRLVAHLRNSSIRLTK